VIDSALSLVFFIYFLVLIAMLIDADSSSKKPDFEPMRSRRVLFGKRRRFP
jgi:hypothetical protein